MSAPAEGDPPKEQVPYSKRPEWQDITPVPQDDGPEPIVVIRYPPGFEEVHGYFRAVQQRNEFSERALRLTADVIEHNSANYTAWWYRRRCLKELGSDLAVELAFTDKWARDCPKNYQVWYHRRWLIAEMASRLRELCPSSEEAEEQVRTLAQSELEYHMDVMEVNDDYKNYNGWSHRQFIVQKFGQWDKELPFVEDLLRQDIRNNSAWNHRHMVVRNTCRPLTDEIRQREIAFTIAAIRKCANNESAWNYLAAYLGDGPEKVSWASVPEVEALCREVLALAPEREQMCRFALEALARVHEARGETQDVLQQYELLKVVDRIRAKYWDWRATSLTAKRKEVAF